MREDYESRVANFTIRLPCLPRESKQMKELYLFSQILINPIKYTKMLGPVAQLGWSVRLITERSPVQIRPGPPTFRFESFKYELFFIVLGV